jgi:hypothetical protein
MKLPSAANFGAAILLAIRFASRWRLSFICEDSATNCGRAGRRQSTTIHGYADGRGQPSQIN